MFVICDRSDCEWFRQIVREHQLVGRGIAVLFSPVYAMPPGMALLPHGGERCLVDHDERVPHGDGQQGQGNSHAGLLFL